MSKAKRIRNQRKQDASAHAADTSRTTSAHSKAAATATEPSIRHKDKPLLTRAYENVFPEKRPGQYDRRADRRHYLIVSLVIAAIIVIIGVCWWAYTEHARYLVSDKLVVPTTSFTSAQVGNVEDTLSEQGFQDISYDREVGITAYGTPEQVSAYKDSYFDKFVSPVLDKIKKSGDNSGSSSGSSGSSETGLGIDHIDISDDLSTISIYTYTDDLDSTILTEVFAGSLAEDALSTITTWNLMNGNSIPTTNLIDINTNETYHTTTAKSTNEIISKIENERINELQSTADEVLDDTDTTEN